MYVYLLFLFIFFISCYFTLFLFISFYDSIFMDGVGLKHACHLQPCKVRDEWLRSFDPAAMLVLRSLWFPPQGRLVCCHAHFLLPFLCHLACHILGQFNLVSPPDKAGARLPRSDGMLHVLLPDKTFFWIAGRKARMLVKPKLDRRTALFRRLWNVCWRQETTLSYVFSMTSRPTSMRRIPWQEDNETFSQWAR